MLLYKSGISGFPDGRCEVRKNFSFSRNTTYGLGGNAPVVYYPKNLIEARRAVDDLNARNQEYFVIGNGSNVLASDYGFSGAVVSTKYLSGIINIGDRLLCLAGTKTGALLAYCKRHNLSGLEYLNGIPATVGGAAYMNAGVGSDCIGNDIISVTVYDGKTRVLSHEMCDFGYRRSTMRGINALILSITVKINATTSKEIERRTDYFKSRRSHLPKGKSCGCVFKNPSGISAGLLIDGAGCKGMSAGGAHVSREHANFIINDGGTAKDVRALIEAVRSRVYEKFGILLREEVVYIGEFNDFNS